MNQFQNLNQPDLNSNENLTKNNLVNNQQTFKHYQTMASSSSSTLSSPDSPQATNPASKSKSHSSSTGSNNSSYIPNMFQQIDSNSNGSFIPYNNTMNNPNYFYSNQPGIAEPIQYSPQYQYYNNHQQNLMDNQMIQINYASNRGIFKQPYRHHRRTGPANELHVRLEECLYQFKCLESERKRIEIEQSHLHMNKKQPTSCASLPIPRLTNNPSRVDRLIVEAFREYNKTWLLISKLDNLTTTIFGPNIQKSASKWLEKINNVQAKRKEELLNGIEREKIGQPVRSNDDNEVIILANSINELEILTSKMRTTLWCAMQISNVNYKNLPVVASPVSKLTDKNQFSNTKNSNDFVKKTFQIKTDLSFNEP